MATVKDFFDFGHTLTSYMSARETGDLERINQVAEHLYHLADLVGCGLGDCIQDVRIASHTYQLEGAMGAAFLAEQAMAEFDEKDREIIQKVAAKRYRLVAEILVRLAGLVKEEVSEKQP
jgi:hypothetical protein